MAAKTKQTPNRTQQPSQTPGQAGGEDWGDTKQPAPVEATATENQTEAQPAEAASGAAAPSEVIQQQIANRTRTDALVSDAVSQKFGAELAKLGEKLSKAKNHIEAIKVLNEAERLNPANKAEAEKRRGAITLIRKRCFQIQQGVAPVSQGANDIAAQINYGADKAARLNLLAETSPELRELLAENAALKEDQNKEKDETNETH